MLRKAALLAVAWQVFALILSGCCPCPQPGSFRFRWTALDIAVHTYSRDSGWIITSSDSAVDFTARNPVLRATLDYELIAKQQACPGLMNQAYACKCAEDAYTPEKNMVAMRVYTLYAFDAAHPAMSDITEYFGELHYSTDSSYLQPLSQVPSYPSYSHARLQRSLYLDKRPAIRGQHQFRATYTLSDSSTVSGVTPVLQF